MMGSRQADEITLETAQQTRKAFDKLPGLAFVVWDPLERLSFGSLGQELFRYWYILRSRMFKTKVWNSFLGTLFGVYVAAERVAYVLMPLCESERLLPVGNVVCRSQKEYITCGFWLIVKHNLY